MFTRKMYEWKGPAFLHVGIQIAVACAAKIRNEIFQVFCMDKFAFEELRNLFESAVLMQTLDIKNEVLVQTPITLLTLNCAIHGICTSSHTAHDFSIASQSILTRSL